MEQKLTVFESNYIKTNNFFARKFSTKIDKEIIDMLYKKVKGQKND